MQPKSVRIAKVFLSCSLRNEDKPFVDFIEGVLKSYRIEPFGTVGKYSASPVNTALLMKQNIPTCDFVVIVATPRYLQKDVKSKNQTIGISEMLHVESGMAYMAEKPIVVFVNDGTNVGNFIPNITQYITLTGTKEDLKQKQPLINSLLTNAYQMSLEKKAAEANKQFWDLLKNGALLYTGIKFIESLDETKKSKKRK
jgi:hypothetical protein